MASALGERAASWSGDATGSRRSSQERVKKDDTVTAKEKEDTRKEKGLPSPPPLHPNLSAPLRVAPSAQNKPSTPPPLPKRSQGRRAHTAGSPTSPVNGDDSTPVQSEDQSNSKSERRLSSQAHLVPLPESRPGTPTARSASPAPMATVTEESPSAPASTPAPPPLPRRAAARGTRPAVGEAGPTSRPSTPANLEAKAEGTKDTTEAPAPVPVTQSDVVLPIEGDKKSGDESPIPDIENGIGGESVEQKKEHAETAQEVTNEVLKEEVPRTSSPDPVDHEDQEKHGEGEKEAIVLNDDKPTIAEVEELTAESKEDGEVKDKNRTAEDKEVYIGDTTWEERTWKELVKLREDMFWARIGGRR